MQLTWGKEKQLSYRDEEEYYYSLGFFANPKLVTISLEPNKKTGSYADAYRLRVLAYARNSVLLPNAIKNAMRDGGRINCNDYVENLISNHGFVLSGNILTASLDNVLKTIPASETKNIVACTAGYLFQPEKTVSVKSVSYAADSIDVSSATLTQKAVPKKGPTKATNSKLPKTGKRDYIKSAIENFEIGEAGEKIVYEHEKLKLANALKAGLISDLNGKLEWVSRADDSLGYDIKSYDVVKGEPIFIEVKTTTGSATTSFFMSDNEIETSKTLGDKYYLYRLYKMNRNKPTTVDYFVLQGDVSKNSGVKIVTQDRRIDII